jgi:hypothetical protein
MVIKELKNLEFAGVIDRLEGSVVIIETDQGFLHMDRRLFPFPPKEGLCVFLRHGHMQKDETATEEKRKRAEELLHE